MEAYLLLIVALGFGVPLIGAIIDSKLNKEETR